MNAEDSEDDLFDGALRLALRLHEAPEDPAAREALRLWRAQGPAHEAAWREAAELYGLAGRALENRRRRATRRTILLGGAAGLGAAAALWGPRLILEAQADHLTGTARIARIPLPAGGGLALGPQGALAMEEGGAARLLEGMLWCDAPHPFRLKAGPLELSSGGGAFGVSLEAGYVTAEAGAGKAEIRAEGLAAPEPLEAGSWLRLGGPAPTRGLRAAGGASWLEGRLIADSEPLAALTARIARWIPQRVVLLDSAFGARRVSGVFDLSEPVEALKAAIRPHGGRLRRLAPLAAIVISGPGSG